MEHDQFESDSVSSPPSTESYSVSDRLKDIIAVQQSDTANKSVSIEADNVTEGEQNPSFGLIPRITTPLEYFDAEENAKLELRKLARRFQEMQPNPTATREERREQVLRRPNWTEYFPKDQTDEELSKWSNFVDGYPRTMQASLRVLYSLHNDFKEAQANPELLQQVEQQRAEQFDIKQSAIAIGAIHRKVDRLEAENQDITWRAANDGEWSESERQTIQQNNNDIDLFMTIEPDFASGLTTEQQKDLVVESSRLEVLRDKAALSRGLLETDQMKAIKHRHLASLLAGEGLMLVGETGGAKTALAKDMALTVQRLLGRHDGYEFVSAYGDINSYQLMGKQELRKQDEATVTEFAFGAIARAMRDGRPLIIDEFNAMPPEITKRLNEILLKRVGDTYALQENGGMEITIRQGFCIIATANDKSDRYRGVEKTSAEMQNRFFASQERVHYPDSNVQVGLVPTELMRLAVAGLADAKGNVPLDAYGITPETFISFLKAAHITQKLFSETANSAMSLYVSDSQIRDRKTGLEDHVISPRAMMSVFEKIRTSGGAATLQTILSSSLDGIPQGSPDRAVMESVLRSQGLLPGEY